MEEFDEVVAGLFTEEELEALPKPVPYSLEPTQPDVGVLIDAYLRALEESKKSRDPQRIREIIEGFAEPYPEITEINPGTQLYLSNPASFVEGVGEMDGEGGRWRVITTPVGIKGRFFKFGVGNWFDIPVPQVPEEVTTYVRKSGLFIVLKEVIMIDEVGQEEDIEGVIRIPLQHGNPELYRVIS